MIFDVWQSFETLGDSCRTTHETREQAERAAETLQREIAAMVAGRELPAEKPVDETGFSSEIKAWAAARDMAGARYDEEGHLVASRCHRSGRRVYGRRAGEHIAGAAVAIAESED